jgi:transposase
MKKRKNRSYTNDFKQEVVALVIEQSGVALDADEQTEFKRLRKENKDLRMEKEILKKQAALHITYG